MTSASPAHLALFDLDTTLLAGDTDVLWCDFLIHQGRLDAATFAKANADMDSFLDNVYGIVDKSVENYLERGFANLAINFGCTGGQHRSVYAADQLARHLTDKYGVRIELQHIEQEKKNWIN